MAAAPHGDIGAGAPTAKKTRRRPRGRRRRTGDCARGTAEDKDTTDDELAPRHFQPYHATAVPRTDLGADSPDESQPVTTAMLRHVPCRYTQNSLLLELDEQGFRGTYDFFYMPMDKQNKTSVGYAFINFEQPSCAQRFFSMMKDYRFKRFPNDKIGEASPAKLQGLWQNITHFANKSVMNARDPKCRPIVFQDGFRCDLRELMAEHAESKNKAAHAASPASAAAATFKAWHTSDSSPTSASTPSAPHASAEPETPATAFTPFAARRDNRQTCSTMPPATPIPTAFSQGRAFEQPSEPSRVRAGCSHQGTAGLDPTAPEFVPLATTHSSSEALVGRAEGKARESGAQASASAGLAASDSDIQLSRKNLEGAIVSLLAAFQRRKSQMESRPTPKHAIEKTESWIDRAFERVVIELEDDSWVARALGRLVDELPLGDPARSSSWISEAFGALIDETSQELKPDWSSSWVAEALFGALHTVPLVEGPKLDELEAEFRRHSSRGAEQPGGAEDGWVADTFAGLAETVAGTESPSTALASCVPAQPSHRATSRDSSCSKNANARTHDAGRSDNIRVKNTFIDFVDEDEQDESSSRQRARSAPAPSPLHRLRSMGGWAWVAFE
eukprot:TRINITY_DN15196_c0_g1_i1.p1 TRINITY_DN15196_c0_g1~~TRINITY_DN15196_c0_g1_i1.p1  ORF type:complete len:629 (+),score=91.81 TRINITY_DN15196_c0_g1_i1:38-1888(+)